MNVQLGHPEVVQALIAAIRRHEKRAIPFLDYMDICLYHEPGGYYRSETVKIGKDGDFYTSSSIGTAMGEMVAAFIVRLAAETVRETEPVSIVEWGGGSGRLALHLLNELRLTAPSLYARLSYTMIESSGYHRRLQAETLKPHEAVVRVVADADWLAPPPGDGIFVLANELLDAFPVHRVRYREGRYEEAYVAWDEQDRSFREVWHPAASKRLLDYMTGLKVQWPDGQIGEVNFAAEDWLHAVAKRVRSGGVIVIDYGDREEEIYGAHRQRGTLMCYRQHQAADDPFQFQGRQDMTAHVNFSLCLDAAARAGFTGCTLRTQREFLVEQGILHKLQEHHDPNPFSEVARKNRAIRQLLLSDQMSELFKVMTAHKKR